MIGCKVLNHQEMFDMHKSFKSYLSNVLRIIQQIPIEWFATFYLIHNSANRMSSCKASRIALRIIQQISIEWVAGYVWLHECVKSWVSWQYFKLHHHPILFSNPGEQLLKSINKIVVCCVIRYSPLSVRLSLQVIDLLFFSRKFKQREIWRDREREKERYIYIYVYVYIEGCYFRALDSEGENMPA